MAEVTASRDMEVALKEMFQHELAAERLQEQLDSGELRSSESVRIREQLSVHKRRIEEITDWLKGLQAKAEGATPVPLNQAVPSTKEPFKLAGMEVTQMLIAGLVLWAAWRFIVKPLSSGQNLTSLLLGDRGAENDGPEEFDDYEVEEE